MKFGIRVFRVDLNKESYAKNPQQPMRRWYRVDHPLHIQHNSYCIPFLPSWWDTAPWCLCLQGRNARVGCLGWSAENENTLSGSVKWTLKLLATSAELVGTSFSLRPLLLFQA